MSVCCECCVLSGRGLRDELITRPEESYRLWYIVVCDLETSWMRRPWPTGWLWRQKQNYTIIFYKFQFLLCALFMISLKINKYINKTFRIDNKIAELLNLKL